jgi:hypothetical protein
MGLSSDERQNSNGVQASLEYLTLVQVAALLQVSPKSVSRWAKKDPSFPCLKIRWLQSREQGRGKSKQPDNLLSQRTEAIDAQGKGLTISAPCA